MFKDKYCIKNKANIKFKLISDVYLACVRHLSNIHAKKSHVPFVCCLLREKNIFPGGIGVVENYLEIPEGWGGYHCYPKMENPKGWGGPI